MTQPGSRADDRATRVAILGGGCGGLAAAWELTASPALRRRFDVTVYEESWRLGGKGASGRAGGGDGDPGSRRIHEHGLHVWFGFYERSFRMLRAAYEEAGLAQGEDWWTVPFQKCDAISLYEQRDDGTWLRQPIQLPRRGGPDRGPPTTPRRLGVGLAVARTTRLLATGVRAELRISGARRGASSGETGDSAAADVAATLDHIADEIDAMESSVTVGADDGAPTATRGHGPLAPGPRTADVHAGRRAAHRSAVRAGAPARRPAEGRGGLGSRSSVAGGAGAGRGLTRRDRQRRGPLARFRCAGRGGPARLARPPRGWTTRR